MAHPTLAAPEGARDSSRRNGRRRIRG